MIKILFICHGNICRSTMAEYVMKYYVKEADLESEFYIDSAATSREEIGNPVHYGTRKFPVETTEHARCNEKNMKNMTI